MIECENLDAGARVGEEGPDPRRRGRGPAGDGLRRPFGDRGAAPPRRRPRRGPGVVDRLFRQESGRAVATLIRVLGDFDAAEEAVQEAFVVALERWPADGLPDNPGRLDHPGRAQQGDRPPAARADAGGQATRARGAGGAADAATSCDPAAPDAKPRRRDRRRSPAADLHLLPSGARAGGADRAHPAHARRPHAPPRSPAPSSSREPTMAQRLVRAKRKIRDARIPYEVPRAGAARRAARARCWRRST